MQNSKIQCELFLAQRGPGCSEPLPVSGRLPPTGCMPERRLWTGARCGCSLTWRSSVYRSDILGNCNAARTDRPSLLKVKQPPCKHGRKHHQRGHVPHFLHGQENIEERNGLPSDAGLVDDCLKPFKQSRIHVHSEGPQLHSMTKPSATAIANSTCAPPRSNRRCGWWTGAQASTPWPRSGCTPEKQLARGKQRTARLLLHLRAAGSG